MAIVSPTPWVFLILLWDEYGSSQEAAERLAYTSKSRRRAPLDAEAAAVILQDYLDRRNLLIIYSEYHNEEDLMLGFIVI